MPKSLGGLLGYVVGATVMFAVGSFVYGYVVSPLLSKLRGSAQ